MDLLELLQLRFNAKEIEWFEFELSVIVTSWAVSTCLVL